MTESNKGRFKDAHEAQAVWNLFTCIYGDYEVEGFKKGDFIAENCFGVLAKDLHRARLIHGSIYDEHGRIEDKDVAHEVYLRAHREYLKCRPYMQPERVYDINDLFRFGFDQRAAHSEKLKGTIFIEV